MARRAVEEVYCDRCKKVEYQAEGAAAHSFSLSLNSSLEREPVRQVQYLDLCERCVQVVLNYTDKLGEVNRRSSEAKKEEDSEGPPDDRYGGDSRAVDGQLPPPNR